MKTNSSIRKSLGAVLLISTVLISNLLTGCQNFLNGSEIKESLNSAIDYANAPSYEVLVTADEGTGSIIIGSGNNTVKVTDYFSIGFRKSSGYKFVHWTAVTKDGTGSMEEYVEFEDRTQLTTRVKLVDASDDIQIKPVCEASLSVKESYPEFKEEGVARDSSIKLIFTAPLSEKNDLSQITIDIDNSNVKGTLHFNDPEIVDNQLVITAKTSNRIAVAGGDLKTVTVTIPADFIYVGENGEFEIGEELKHTYRINSTTSDKTFITYGTPEENAGTVKVNGIAASSVSQQYSIGETVTVSFKVSEGYLFEGWECSDEGAVLLQKPEGDMYDENGYNETTKTATVILKIINESKNVTFTAKVVAKDKLAINFGYEHGAMVPAEKKELYLDDEFTLSYREEPGYAFTGWKIIDENSGDEITDVLELSGKGTDVTVKVLAVGKKVKVIAETAVRPKVVSATPLYDTSGVYRDRPIVIMFSKEMSEKSIYWTEEELTAMKVSLENAFEATGITYNENGIQKKYYYAYWDGHDENSYVYKNISITKYTNDSINYLQNYGIPKFDDSNTRVLRIPAKLQKNGDQIISMAPPGATDILVTLSKNFFYEQNQKLINLSEDYSWTYATNMDTDVYPPVFDTESLAVLFADSNQKTYDSTKTKIDNSILPKLKSNPKDNIPLYNAKNKTFWVKGKFTDAGSGPANLQWYITKVNSDYYPSSQNTLVAQGKILELFIQGDKATIGSGDNANETNGGVLIDVSENLVNGLTDLPEGTFALYFEAFDKNGTGTKSEPFYFVYDVTPPAASTVVHTSTIAKDIVKVQKNVNTSKDFSYTYIENVRFDENVKVVKQIENLGSTTNHHTLTVKDYDYAGNCGESTVEVTAAASVGMIYYTDGYYSTDYDSTRTPEGVVCKVESNKKFYIWDIWDQYGYCWGNLNLKKTTSGSVNLAHMDVNVSGVDVYDTLVNNLGEPEMLKKGMSRTQKWEDGKLSPTIWSYVLDKNQETKPVNAGVKSEKWFIPSRVELRNIIRNLETMNTAFDKIISGYGHSARERINSTDYAYRQVQLIQVDGYYWTSMLHWDRNSGAPATFQASGNLNNDALRWLGMYNDTEYKDLGSHTYKGKSIILYQTALDNRTSDEGLFYMDRCIRYTGWSSGLTAAWEHQDMKTHAMALVEME